MAGSFLSSAGRKTTDIRGFLREAASGGNSIKYKAEAGKKHFIYIPYISVEDVDDNGNNVVKKQLVAIAGAVHDWMEGDKYRATVCLKDVIRTADDGTLINDGSCPFCNRTADAWGIYNYRLKQEEETCGKTGTALAKHLEDIKGKFADERKAKDARDYMYILIVKFRTDASNKPIMGSDGLPEYDLKVVKWSASRAEKIQQQIENSGDEFAGTEMIFEYPNNDDIRQVVGQSTTSPVFPNSRFTNMFPALKDKINADVAKFTWEGIDKAYPEWAGMSSAEAEKTATDLFKAWDEYQLELKVNPNAKYLEYVGTAGPAVSNPALNAQAAPQIGAAPQAAPGVAPQVAPQVAPAPQVDAPVQMPGAAPALDANQVFGGVDLNNI